MLKNRHSAIHVKHGGIFFIFIFSNHRLINLLIVINLLVRVFVFCKQALVVFLSEIHVPFYSNLVCVIIFCYFL